MCLVFAPLGGGKRRLTTRLRGCRRVADDVMNASSYGYVILVALSVGAISTCVGDEDDFSE